MKMEEVKQEPEAPSLTPTQSLVLEVLGARYRLGESIWPFDKIQANTRACTGLEVLGLVGTRSGPIEHSFQVWLTQAGKDYVLGAEYESPLDRLKQELRTAKEKIERVKYDLQRTEERWTAECVRNAMLTGQAG